MNRECVELGIAQSFVCWLTALVRRRTAWWWKGIDAKLGGRIDVWAGGERARVESARRARVGGRVEIIGVGIGGIAVLTAGRARICGGLRV